MGTPNYFGGLSIYQDQFLGARFELSSGATIDGVGGHMFRTGIGNLELFGALVALTSLDDVPDSVNLSTPDVLAFTTFEPPVQSNDVIAPIGPIDVPAGYYAVVFGSGLFGATGTGGAPDNNAPNDATALYNLKYQAGFGWDRIGNRGVRFTAYGTIPEPSAMMSMLAGGVAIVMRRPSRRRGQEIQRRAARNRIEP
jgi:hypothetical protein